jgi:glycosyltransferase involved in cell wall biosynthesis
MRRPGPIRVAHVCSSDLAIPALMPFCRPLLARGWEITMITPDGPHVAPGREAGLRWLPLSLQRRMHFGSDVVGTLELARYFVAHDFDVVHTHNIKAGHIGRVVAAAMRVPIVTHTIHGMAYSRETPWLRRNIHAALERIACLGCDMVFSQSQEDLETCVATKVTTSDKVLLIGNGIDLSRFDPESPALVEARSAVRRELGLAPDEVLFLSAGRLIVEKGFVELFEAAIHARAKWPKLRLAVAGPLDERSDTLDEATLARARAAGILLLGQRKDMPAVYAASDGVVLASWHEGMPRVLMEGAAMGKPLVATNVRGCREVVVPPDNGLLVPVQDAGALADAMLTLARDPVRRAELGRRNAHEARERYAIERPVSLVTQAYERLLADRQETVRSRP